MIFIYFDEDKDERLTIMGSRLYQFLIDMKQDIDLHIYEHEGGLRIYSDNFKKINFNSFSFDVQGDIWSMEILEKRKFLESIGKKKLEKIDKNLDLKYADKIIF